MPDCKVISTYFGPRRRYRNRRGWDSVDVSLGFFRRVVDLERLIDSGRPHDTIIVNHDMGDRLVGNERALSFLAEIDGALTRNGLFRVVNRPWDDGIGGSFKSFNVAFERFRDAYDYWFFTEDNVITIRPGYFQHCVEQLERSPDVAFVCTLRTTPLGQYKRDCTRLHCHGGAGCTHRRFLEALYEAEHGLPYSRAPRPADLDLSTREAQRWYRQFEVDGEVGFTTSYLKLGYRLEDVDLDDPVCEFYGELF